MTEISDSHIILKQLQFLSYITTIYIMPFLVLVIPCRNPFVIYFEKAVYALNLCKVLKKICHFWWKDDYKSPKISELLAIISRFELFLEGNRNPFYAL